MSTKFCTTIKAHQVHIWLAYRGQSLLSTMAVFRICLLIYVTYLSINWKYKATGPNRCFCARCIWMTYARWLTLFLEATHSSLYSFHWHHPVSIVRVQAFQPPLSAFSSYFPFSRHSFPSSFLPRRGCLKSSYRVLRERCKLVSWNLGRSAIRLCCWSILSLSNVNIANCKP